MDIKHLLSLCGVACALVAVSGCAPEEKQVEENTGTDTAVASDAQADDADSSGEADDSGPITDGVSQDTDPRDSGDDTNTGDTSGADTRGADGTSCADGESRCDGQCVDTDSSTDHCGTCGSPCEVLGDHTRVACALGECIRRCENGWIDEDGDWTEADDPSGTNGCETECSPSNGGTEVCDGKDNDCDGEVDEGVESTFYRDEDGDGSGDPMTTKKACSAPSGFVGNAEDCDDTKAAVHPGAEEVCDGKIDHDCDNQVGEKCPCTNGQTKPCGTDTGVCTKGTKTCKMGEWSTCSGDSGGKEVCDGKDNDCDGQIDEGVSGKTYYYDQDMDGYGYNMPLKSCTDPGAQWSQKKGDCNDNDPAINPGASEVCDLRDNDCDGLTDENLTKMCSRRLCRRCTRLGKRCRQQAGCINGTQKKCCY